MSTNRPLHYAAGVNVIPYLESENVFHCISLHIYHIENVVAHICRLNLFISSSRECHSRLIRTSCHLGIMSDQNEPKLN